MSPQATFIVAASADRGVTANASVSTPTNTSDAHRAERIVERAPKRDHTFKPMVTDRKSTRLNSSHGYISYAVFCLKKKKIQLIARHEVVNAHLDFNEQKGFLVRHLSARRVLAFGASTD